MLTEFWWEKLRNVTWKTWNLRGGNFKIDVEYFRREREMDSSGSG